VLDSEPVLMTTSVSHRLNAATAKFRKAPNDDHAVSYMTIAKRAFNENVITRQDLLAIVREVETWSRRDKEIKNA
jgi:hypothetical protein